VDRQTCAIKTSGALSCWACTRARPRRCRSETDIDWASVRGGAAHTLRDQERRHRVGWYEGTFGKLGIGSTAFTFAPAQIGGAIDWSEVAPRRVAHLWPARRGIACWGRNQKGQLGGGVLASSTIPRRVDATTTWVDRRHRRHLWLRDARRR